MESSIRAKRLREGGRRREIRTIPVLSESEEREVAIVRRRSGPVSAALGRERHPVLARVYAARGVASPEDLDYRLAHLLPDERLRGIDAAVELLCEALERRRRILVVGDFDADGATGCAVAVSGLRLFGAEQVDYLVPNRFRFGYGLTPEIVEVAAGRAPDLLITVDNGTSSVEGVDAANARGIKVIVTDHHLAGAILPRAAALVNPNQPNDAFPSKCLAGVGVMFYLLVALRRALRRSEWFERKAIPVPRLADLLDLVAVGTIADVVPLDRNNRILVSQGLARIRAGRCRPGIEALLRVAGRDPARATASDIGFALAPRLNAAGRLEDMSLGIECLLAPTPALARERAGRLDELNRERREIEQRMQEQALSHLQGLALGTSSALPLGLCLYDERWHPGVVGILASRIKDRYHRPVIAFAGDGEHELKGSARSVAGVHVRDVLDAVAAAHPGLLTRFGGHAMAAGLSLEHARFDDFSRAFDAEVRRHISESMLRGATMSDGELDAEDLSLEIAYLLRDGGPWGQGFPEPCFDGEFDVREARVVGERHVKLVLRLTGTGRNIDAIAFNAASEWPRGTSRARIAYRLGVNFYQGLESPQLVVEDWEKLD